MKVWWRRQIGKSQTFSTGLCWRLISHLYQKSVQPALSWHQKLPVFTELEHIIILKIAFHLQDRIIAWQPVIPSKKYLNRVKWSRSASAYLHTETLDPLYYPIQGFCYSRVANVIQVFIVQIQLVATLQLLAPQLEDATNKSFHGYNDIYISAQALMIMFARLLSLICACAWLQGHK